CACASSSRALICSTLPSKSPMVGLVCAIAIRRGWAIVPPPGVLFMVYRPSGAIAGNILTWTIPHGSVARRRRCGPRSREKSGGPAQDRPEQARWLRFRLTEEESGSSRSTSEAVEQARDGFAGDGILRGADLEEVVLHLDLHVARAEELY